MRKKLVKEAAITAARVVFESGGSAAESWLRLPPQQKHLAAPAKTL